MRKSYSVWNSAGEIILPDLPPDCLNRIEIDVDALIQLIGNPRRRRHRGPKRK